MASTPHTRPTLTKAKSFSVTVQAHTSEHAEYKQLKHSKCCSDIVHDINTTTNDCTNKRIAAPVETMKRRPSFLAAAHRLSKYHSDDNKLSTSPSFTRLSSTCTNDYNISSKNGEDSTVAIRVPLRRKHSFIPQFRRSLSNGQTDERQKQYQSPLKGMKPNLPALVDDDGKQLQDDNKLHQSEYHRVLDSDNIIPTKRGHLFRRSISISPKSVVGASNTSPSLLSLAQNQALKPPLVRNMSFNNETYNTFDDSEHSRSPASTPTLTSISLSDLFPMQDEQSIETTASGIVGSVTALIVDKNGEPKTDGLECHKENDDNNKIHFVLSMFRTISIYLLNYVILIGSLFNVQAIMNTLWKVSFDLLVEVVTLTLDVMSYSIFLSLRILETAMFWFVQQVYIRSIFIFIYNMLKNRKKNTTTSDKQQLHRVIGPSSNSIQNESFSGNTKRPMRFLYIPKDIVRRKNVHVGSYKD